MSSHVIPPAVRRFIAAYLDSAEQLDILQLLYCDPRKEWSSKSVSIELRTNETSTRKRLEGLCQSGILAVRTQDGASTKLYRYNPTPNLREQIQNFFLYYPKYRLRVYEVLFSDHGDALKVFSDSFDFSKKRDE